MDARGRLIEALANAEGAMQELRGEVLSVCPWCDGTGTVAVDSGGCNPDGNWIDVPAPCQWCGGDAADPKRIVTAEILIAMEAEIRRTQGRVQRMFPRIMEPINDGSNHHGSDPL